MEHLEKESTSISHLNFFKCEAKYNEAHYKPTIISPTNLTLLQKITGLPFIAKMRKTPRYTVDALLFCDTQIEADNVKCDLSDKKIIADVLTTSTGKYCICVRAINVNHYAEAIARKYRAAI